MNDYSVIWSPRSLKDLDAIETRMARRVLEAMDRFARDGTGDVKRLQVEPGYRLRVGDWRVRFDMDHEAKSFRVNRVLHRSQAY